MTTPILAPTTEQDPALQVRKAAGHDLPALVETLTAACFDDPVMTWSAPVPEPHAYLFLLGARPRWQSRGLGSALLRTVLEQCDREGTPAYLEASSPDNRRLYLRHGFEVTGEIALPDGPSMWPMWRAPLELAP